MSRRETTINVLLGTFLVLVFFLPFLALMLAIYLLDLFTTRFLPGVAVHRDILFDVIIAGSVLVEMVDALRWSRWRNAFLSFAVLSVFIIVSTTHLWLGNSSDMFWFFFAVIYFGIMPPKLSKREDIDRLQFFLGTMTVSGLFAAETKLLGAGLLSQVVRESSYVVLLLWFAIRTRGVWQQNNDGPKPSSVSAA